MEPARHVWVRRAYGTRWMPGLVIEWRQTPLEHGHAWDALCMVTDLERAWVEWFALEEMRPVPSDPPGA